MFNEKFVAKEMELKTKYADIIAGIAEANEMDLGVGFDMLAANVERGTNYVGGGDCTALEWTELIEDFKALRALARV